MREIVDLRDKIKRYYNFTPLEVRSIAIAVLVTAFVFSFKEWGGNAFDVKVGLFNYFNAILIVGLSFLIHISAQRIWALATGFKLEWKMWSFGLLISLIMAFLTNGFVWLILPGGVLLHHMAGHRLGWFRYDINYWALGLTTAMGTIATIGVVLIFKSIGAFVSNALIDKLILFNIAYALYSLVPIPPLDGSRIFFGSRMFYAFFVSFTILITLLIFSNISVGIALLSSFVAGLIFWISYYIFFEHKAWRGL
jgi:Zn-dependent protease